MKEVKGGVGQRKSNTGTLVPSDPVPLINSKIKEVTGS